MAEAPEPWLRGARADVHPLIMPVFFSFAQVREDLDRHTTGLTTAQLWQLFGKTSVGFHLKHIAGSVDRLATYLMGDQLTEQQLSFLQHEHEADRSLPEVLQLLEGSLTCCEERLRRVNPEQVFAGRTVGRGRLPTTVLGLLVHLAEHTQRHLGQAITLCQLLHAGD